jgi:transcription elongation factor GreA
MKKIHQITAEGKIDLETELEALKGRRGEIADKIAEARDFGDLSENAEYDVAREEQGLVETRIAEIEEILQNANIIKNKISSQKVELGSKVELKTVSKQVTYTIVGPVEANPLEGKVSDKSPIGIALFGKKIGDEIIISTPKGDTKYKISNID